jgi:hypothetical protein
LLESGSGVEAAFLIEMVKDRGVNGGELLETSHAMEPLHGSFLSSKRRVQILSLIVELPTGFLANLRADLCQRGTKGAQAIGDHHLGLPMLAHCFLKGFNAAFLSRLWAKKNSAQVW